MPKDLQNDIKLVELIPIQVINTTTEGAAVDTYLPDGFKFPSALVKAGVGDLGSQASTKIKIQEDDDSGFGTSSTAEGGDEVTVSADSVYNFQIARKKRYLRAVVTFTTPGATPSAEIHISGILCDWGKPFPIL